MSADDVARYKRRPRKGQFQPGQTGNPRGRPKGSKNIRTYLLKLLIEKIPLSREARQGKFHGPRPIAIQLINLALKADPKGLAAVVSMTREFDEATGQARPDALSRIPDIAVMNDIIARIRDVHPLPSPEADSDPTADESAHGLESPESSPAKESE